MHHGVEERSPTAAVPKSAFKSSSASFIGVYRSRPPFSFEKRKQDDTLLIHREEGIEDGCGKAEMVGKSEPRVHYFLSHTKNHSVWGGVPGQIARNIHDNLELLGHSGWSDVDNLSVINEDALRGGIAKCISMTVLFNDETADSEWCRFEWRVAQELDIPIKAVVDMERATKSLALEKLQDCGPGVLTHQLSEPTERDRRDCLSSSFALFSSRRRRIRQPWQNLRTRLSLQAKEETTGMYLFIDGLRSPFSSLERPSMRHTASLACFGLRSSGCACSAALYYAALRLCTPRARRSTTAT